ncbi:hypothetical protein MHI39_19885 [Heyndrickxia sp. FSL K6-6286]|jgi:hypothetical protein|uniref:hypothetical protein n=1 Tax=Heyndrickxia TaxID=2837504 RepID=UPI000716F696|nr:hypothetical protein [Heyndrickxia oleronia]NYV68093.1 hypothetical protein [Bacillus sp. Gen3]MBU5213090.1 hypothetical protein [Heyndrickxia oleronia]MCI1593128.1 hypothetical protein [Heyndrickxia oleronia]MCI1615342.1 hypothetical protein [Heyndrickxia oleronia]MCI1746117.1 hypothetical protein [Heyndrickxia oleronia]
MEYPLMSPSLELKPFEKMTKKEAENHFNWYLSEIPNRIALLRETFSKTGEGKIEDLDFTPKSLQKIWEWFLPNIEIISKSDDEINEEINEIPVQFKDIISIDRRKFSTGTLSIGMDIAIYFAEIFIKNYDNLTWGLITKPKSLVYVNRPVVVGFSSGVELDPRLLVYNLILNKMDGSAKKEDLYNLFEVWEEDI